MSDGENDQITCASYTHARRHPMVIGQIGGWTPPFQLSFPQVGVLLAVIWLEYQTWNLWLGFLPSGVALFIAAALPLGLAWAVRRTRLEGRSLVRTAIAWVGLLAMPKPGRAGGRAHRPARAAALGRRAVFVAPGDDGS